VIVAVRDDVRRRCGEFCFPPPVSDQRPAKTILAPLVKYEGKRFASADFVRCDPVRYDSGLIKAGSVAPHTRAAARPAGAKKGCYLRSVAWGKGRQVPQAWCSEKG
jgi:hypothetical protein